VDKEHPMTYSTGPGGYGGAGQGPNSPPYTTQPGGYAAPTQAFSAPSTANAASAPSTPGQPAGQGKSLPFYLNIAVAALGAINFLLGGFTETFFLPGLGLLLAAAAVAGFAMLPKQAALDVVVAGLTITGFMSLLFAFVGPDNGLINASMGFILVLVLAFVQSALAIAVLLFASEILKPPQPGPKQQPHYGYYGQGYGQPGAPTAGYGQPNQPHQPYYGGAAGQTYQPPSQQQQPQQPQQSGQGQPPQQQQW
jgi:Family of unknown function (DUF5336)